MGLIKTAIISGAGIYAINKIAKSAEHRQQATAPYYPPQPHNQARSGNEHQDDRYYDSCQTQQGDYQYAQGQQQQYAPPAYGQGQRYEEKRTEYRPEGSGSGSGMRDAVMGIVGQIGSKEEKGGRMNAIEKLFK